MYVFIGDPAMADSVAAGDIRRIQAFKGQGPLAVWRRGHATIAGFPRLRNVESPMAELPGRAWVVGAGTWVHDGGIRSGDLDALLARFIQVGAKVLAGELDGVFAIVFGDLVRGKVSVLTDPCGSLHLYRRDGDRAVAFSTSPAGLSSAGELDPIAVHEFVATGIVYEHRSLWKGVEKQAPGSVLEIDTASMQRQSRVHWNFADIDPESLRLGEAAEALHEAMTRSIRSIGRSFRSVTADLTGGYDSRMLLAGLLSSGIEFQSTVSGPTDSADVQVAQGLARTLGRTVVHRAPASGLDAGLIDRAVRLCDGECDVFDTARILTTHLPASEAHDISLNGSFGELARGYWWELLWPRLAAARPLDTSMVARRRFAAAPYDASVLGGPAAFDFTGHMMEVTRRAVSDLSHLPNTSQMDGLYFRLRMQRWQGRIASTTNQIWPAISPLAFRAVLKVMLEAQAKARFRSLLPRTMFARKCEALADFPLEHGYPPRPMTLANAMRFLPVATYYGNKVLSRLRSRLPSSKPQIPAEVFRARHRKVFDEMPLADWLSAPALAGTGLFRSDLLLRSLDPSQRLAGHRLDQMHRLVSIECALRAWQQASADAGDARLAARGT